MKNPYDNERTKKIRLSVDIYHAVRHIRQEEGRSYLGDVTEITIHLCRFYGKPIDETVENVRQAADMTIKDNELASACLRKVENSLRLIKVLIEVEKNE